MNRKNLFLVVAALLLVALGNWLTEEGVQKARIPLTPKPEAQLDYYLSGVTITTLDANGEPQQRLQATQLSHYTAGELTRLKQPAMEILKDNIVQWQLSAESGLLNQKSDEVQLEGNVILTRSGGEQPLQLRTSALRVEPRQGAADTDQSVSLEQAQNRITAVGMKIENQGQRIILLSKVRGRYESLVP